MIEDHDQQDQNGQDLYGLKRENVVHCYGLVLGSCLISQNSQAACHTHNKLITNNLRRRTPAATLQIRESALNFGIFPPISPGNKKISQIWLVSPTIVHI